MNDLQEAVRTTVHRAFGLNVSSRVPLPELPLAGAGTTGRTSAGTASAKADVEIDWAEPEELLRELEACGSNFSYARAGENADERRFLFLIPDTAVYAIREGRHIAVAPLPGADPERVRVYLLGTCMGALLLMRRVFPLHGSAVVIDGRAYAFLGESGAGKSTLAAACAALGHRLVSDDVVAVTLDAEGKPYVQPAYPQQKLWRESLEGLGMASGSYRTIYRETEKFAVPAEGSFQLGQVPLAGVYELLKPSLIPPVEPVGPAPPIKPIDLDSKITALRPVSNLERLRVLMQHTYRNRLVPRLGLEDWHFQAAAAVASRIDMGRLQRPQHGFTAGALAEFVIHNANRGEW